MTKKTIKRASADVGIIFTGFNLRRLINIIGRNEFKKFLEGLVLSVFVIIESYRNITSNLRHLIFQLIFFHPKKKTLRMYLNASFLPTFGMEMVVFGQTAVMSNK
ncbi:MAG: hypothetical protein IPK25_07100 [Saprospiraceae bacterium]|nr:hypothetical protein [Saprospiraceae bacterium]